ncbi:T9SS type A sorting domain-containing protein [Spirosoma agri]|uniref:T9SS type A sorting domain-containing protein n=1 Tax=Spirosoma agri TaxID=1987381 RepID=A0A6M0ID38_9BACT|nr:T9SS type A sorting domain-containing protein [Spirosoma agri]NEU65737.1 T9SS type A sorting domain-containing protein [Spirosoma agri]
MRTFLLLSLLILGGQVSYGTHLLGGYIQVKPIAGSSLTYEVTATLYLNEREGATAADNMNGILLCFGDGQTQTVTRQSRLLVSNREISVNTYRMNHTYAGPGTYSVTTSLQNRTPSVNIPNSATQQESLTLRTTFLTNTTPNQTPALALTTASFQIAANQRTTLSLQAKDAEGDSLVYALTRPLTINTNDPCSFRSIGSYQFPNDLTRQGTFKLASRTGELTWDMPTQLGYFSVAITVSEYRNGVLLSQTIEEIPLIVVDKPGTPGVLPPYEPALEGALVTALSNYKDEDVSFTVFPNPVDDRLQVVVQTSQPSTVSLRLVDANGRELHRLAFNRVARQHEQVIGMGSLAQGVYLIHATIDGRSMVRKIIKK